MVQREMRPGMIVQQQEEVQSKEKCKNEETVLKAHVEQGMDNGAELTFPRMSEQLPGQIHRGLAGQAGAQKDGQ